LTIIDQRGFNLSDQPEAVEDYTFDKLVGDVDQEETYPPVKCPVLMIHGLDDMWLMPEALNDSYTPPRCKAQRKCLQGDGRWVNLRGAISWSSNGA
jgi:pimeloyl-ACP methyl ester carboxylesterase